LKGTVCGARRAQKYNVRVVVQRVFTHYLYAISCRNFNSLDGASHGKFMVFTIKPNYFNASVVHGLGCFWRLDHSFLAPWCSRIYVSWFSRNNWHGNCV